MVNIIERTCFLCVHYLKANPTIITPGKNMVSLIFEGHCSFPQQVNSMSHSHSIRYGLSEYPLSSSDVHDIPSYLPVNSRIYTKHTVPTSTLWFPYAPWCWNIYQHLSKNDPNVDKYSIYGAYGVGSTNIIVVPDAFFFQTLHQFMALSKTWLSSGYVKRTIEHGPVEIVD